MNSSQEDDVVGSILGGTAEQLDLPSHVLALADQIYDDVAIYLSDHLPGHADWAFYPQGSARTGTGVPPVGTDEWDIDAVAEADLDKHDIGKAELKRIVGEALTNYTRERADDDKIAPIGIEPGRRCWTLLYDGFHLDVLPAVPNRDERNRGIWITDRDMERWQRSNPRGYAEWFEARMLREFNERRAELAKAASVSIDDIPRWRVKTTLQRTVQVLKLHRNSFFADDLDNRPPSCVVTTLAGLAYNGESSLTEALLTSAAEMPRFINTDGPIWIVENPAQPGDNLADRWSAEPGSLARFGPWLNDLQRTISAARTTKTGMRAVVETLSTRFDRSLLEKSMDLYAQRQSSRRDAGALVISSTGALAMSTKGTTVRQHTFHGV